MQDVCVLAVKRQDVLRKGLKTGQDDPQDGPAVNEPWIIHLDWSGQKGFSDAKRELWRLAPVRQGSSATLGHKPDPKGDVVGYWKTYGTLTHVVVRNAGHMVPHDQPAVSQASFLNVTHACFSLCSSFYLHTTS